MEDLDDKHRITLKLSNTIATLISVQFASDQSHRLEKVAGLLKQKSGSRVKISAYFQHQSSYGPCLSEHHLPDTGCYDT